MRLPHTPGGVAGLRQPSPDAPWRMLVSGCLRGMQCGVDGTDYGMGGTLREFFEHPAVQLHAFCPEDVGIGTPRTMPDIHGGDGFAVLDGTARVLDEHGTDLTAGMVAGAEAMHRFALEHDVELAVLTDMSAACGTQVISDGCRFDEPRRFTAGVGVAAALLLRSDIAVVAQRDHATIHALWQRLDPSHAIPADALDHHQGEWFVGYFG